VFKLQSSNLTTVLEAMGLEIQASKNCQMAPMFANTKDSSVACLEGAGLEMHLIGPFHAVCRGLYPVVKISERDPVVINISYTKSRRISKC
jgi:hypothetical protein